MLVILINQVLNIPFQVPIQSNVVDIEYFKMDLGFASFIVRISRTMQVPFEQLCLSYKLSVNSMDAKPCVLSNLMHWIDLMTQQELQRLDKCKSNAMQKGRVLAKDHFEVILHDGQSAKVTKGMNELSDAILKGKKK